MRSFECPLDSRHARFHQLTDAYSILIGEDVGDPGKPALVVALGNHLYGSIAMRASHRAIGHCVSQPHVFIVCSDEILGCYRSHEKCDPALSGPGHFKIDDEPRCETFMERGEIAHSIPAALCGRFDMLFHNDGSHFYSF